MKCMQAAHCKYCIVRDSMYPINMSLAEILSQFSTQTLDDTDHTIDHQQCQKLQQGESSISSHCQLQTCSSSDSMRALIGLMPEPVANSRHVG